MKKTDFFSFILSDIKNLSVEQKVIFLEKIQDDWIPQIRKKETKNYIKCRNCKRYIKKNEYIFESKQVVNKGECVYHDAGYGDSDEYGDVTYLIVYRTCPKCKSKIILDKQHLKTENVHTRYE